MYFFYGYVGNHHSLFQRCLKLCKNIISNMCGVNVISGIGNLKIIKNIQTQMQ